MTQELEPLPIPFIPVRGAIKYNSALQHVQMALRMGCLTFCTVLVLIKLTKFAVALRLRCGSCKLIF